MARRKQSHQQQQSPCHSIRTDTFSNHASIWFGRAQTTASLAQTNDTDNLRSNSVWFIAELYVVYQLVLVQHTECLFFSRNQANHGVRRRIVTTTTKINKRMEILLLWQNFYNSLWPQFENFMHIVKKTTSNNDKQHREAKIQIAKIRRKKNNASKRIELFVCSRT